jgi:hypothetical protein
MGSQITWIKYLYVLKRDTVFIYEKDNYEKPFEILDVREYSVAKGSQDGSSGKKWILELCK